MICMHDDIVEYPQTFKNGTIHIRKECLSCNKFLGYKPQKIETFKVWFGKHKGEMLKDIPQDYIKWYVKNGIDKKVINRMKTFLDSQS